MRAVMVAKSCKYWACIVKSVCALVFSTGLELLNAGLELLNADHTLFFLPPWGMRSTQGNIQHEDDMNIHNQWHKAPNR